MAEASAGLADWRPHLEAAVETAADAGARVDAAMVLGLALNRAQTVPLPSKCSIARRHRSIVPTRSAVLLEAASAGVEIANAVAAPGVDGRRRAVRGRSGC